MATHSITAKQLPGAMRKLMRNISRGTVQAARSGLVPAKKILVAATPGIGPLKRGWEAHRGTGDQIGSLENHVWFAGRVERGSRPMKLDAGLKASIRKWVETRIGKIAKADGRNSPRGEHRRAEIDRVSGEIIERVETFGYQPHYFARNSLDAVGREIFRRVEAKLETVDRGGE